MRIQFEALKKIQSSEVLCAIPVIAVSANALSHEIERALNAGFHGYVTKPFEIDKLMKIVMDALDERESN